MPGTDADEARQRQTTKSVKLTPETHGRLKEHCREGETLSGCVDRALDALDEDTRNVVKDAAREGAKEALEAES